MMVYVIIPVHNRKEFTKNCLFSLRKQTYKEFKVVVIDDGSTDGTNEMLVSEFSEVHVINGNGNLWWTAATNLGIKYALENNADYVLTLNNDTIASNDFLEELMLGALTKPNALIGSLWVNSKTNEVIEGGYIANWLTGKSVSVLKSLSKEEQRGLHPVTHFAGRGLLIPSKVFNSIGLFDEKNFPHYAADYDFTHKARRNGYEIFCCYNAKLYIFPEESVSETIRKKMTVKNYFDHLFSIKGGGNIIIFIKYAVKNCPEYFLVPYLLIGIIKRILGFPIKVFRTTLK